MYIIGDTDGKNLLVLKTNDKKLAELFALALGRLIFKELNAQTAGENVIGEPFNIADTAHPSQIRTSEIYYKGDVLVSTTKCVSYRTHGRNAYFVYYGLYSKHDIMEVIHFSMGELIMEIEQFENILQKNYKGSTKRKYL